MDLALLFLAATTVILLIVVERQGSATARQVRRILELEEQQIMNEQDLQNALDDIKSKVTAVAARQTTLAQTVTDLQAQLAAGTPVSQAQLDALTTEATEIAGILAPLVA